MKKKQTAANKICSTAHIHTEQKYNKNDNQVLLSAECESGTVLLIIRIETSTTKIMDKERQLTRASEKKNITRQDEIRSLSSKGEEKTQNPLASIYISYPSSFLLSLSHFVLEVSYYPLYALACLCEVCTRSTRPKHTLSHIHTLSLSIFSQQQQHTKKTHPFIDEQRRLVEHN